MAQSEPMSREEALEGLAARYGAFELRPVPLGRPWWKSRAQWEAEKQRRRGKM